MKDVATSGHKIIAIKQRNLMFASILESRLSTMAAVTALERFHFLVHNRFLHGSFAWNPPFSDICRIH